MAMDNINNTGNINGANLDISKFFKGNDEVKEVNDVSIFDDAGNINQDLLGAQGFRNALHDGQGFWSNLFTKGNMSQQNLQDLYSLAGSLDGQEGLSEDELKFLASYGKDGSDNEGKMLNEDDIKAFLQDVESGNVNFAPIDDTVVDVPPSEPPTGDPFNNNLAKLQGDLDKIPVEPEPEPEPDFKLVTSDEIKADENGSKYIEAKDGSSLYQIMQDYYDWDSMGIKQYSEDFHQIAEQIMNANPEIFGEDKGKNNLGEHRNRANLSSRIYDGYKFVLPEIASAGYKDGDILK